LHLHYFTHACTLETSTRISRDPRGNVNALFFVLHSPALQASRLLSKSPLIRTSHISTLDYNFKFSTLVRFFIRAHCAQAPVRCTRAPRRGTPT
jgi:hypothetical protein